MLFAIIALALIAAALSVCLVAICVMHSEFFCTSKAELFNYFQTHKEKFELKNLTKSRTSTLLSHILSKKTALLFSEKKVFEQKNFLLTLSKIIDLKINKSKIKYRAKGNLVLIEQISSVVASGVLKSNECNLFANYKVLCRAYSLKIKEQKIFKVLLGKQLLVVLYGILLEEQEIKKVIQKSKYLTKPKAYKKQILSSSQIYAIKKFNPNSTKLLSNFNQNIPKIAENLFYELLNSELKSKIILAYLTNMFS